MQNDNGGSIIDAINAATRRLDEKSGGAVRLVITAGPTCEDIDAVRFITNRSSGMMGVTLADRAAAQWMSVLLILGPSALAPSDDVECVRVRSAEDMRDAVMAALPWCDALVMSAAVADYTPAEPLEGKLKKSDGDLVIR
ncbi:MAG: phosphopantothenoylcysteine decarboxylase, partial [Planctomycetes bacterium]|nr:phosphopantothenoylcysteine decarboxylase [Planctomycetota bacterium]